MSTTYVAGELATLVTDRGVVLAPPDRLAELVALAEHGPEAWTTLGDLPELAAVRHDGAQLRIVVRGGYAVRVGGLSVDGRGSASGTETSTPLVAGTVVELGLLGVPLAAAGLPLTGGVVRSGGVRWCPAGPAAPAVPEHTVVRTPASPATPATPAAAPAPAAPAPAAPTPAAPMPTAPMPTSPPPGWDPSPDHDGRTITPAQLQALRAAPQPAPGPPTAAPGQPPAPAPTSAPAVPAAPAGPPPARPLVALRLSTGRVVPVRRRVLLGRSPRVQQVGGSANLPALVTVEDPYVSGTHLEVSSDGTRVTATDTSTNGTLLTRPGLIPVPLDRGVATEVAIGDVLTLSKGFTATVVPAHEAAEG